MAGIESPTTGTGLEVDATMKAARVSIRPAEVLGWQSVGVQSGAIATVAANGPVFSLRNISTKLIIIRRVGIGFIATTGFTAAQKLDFGLTVARNFTASDSGGTAIAFTGSNGKHRTSLGTPSSLDARIATTAALTAGTRTLDTNALAMIGGYAAALGVGAIIAPALNNMFTHDAGDYPLVLAQNEGLILSPLTTMGAGGAGNLFVNLEFAEADTF